MRLIELRLTNLNSLKGSWQINFTHEAFINEGIFAITGQTGAGKTTILDAICLALYSQTPRLGKITGTANDIMTQGTGECAAEVVIEIGGKQYCCSWYQHRAYKKAGGKLAAIKHQISELPSGNLLEDVTSKTAPYIQELMGMDFDQFTRSIMLAQGSFAAFLKSDIANRAALLEKITGTAIYAKISKQVFEKFRDEKQQLEHLQEKIAHLPVLSLEDEQQLSQSLNELTDKQNSRRQQLQTLNEQWRWLEQINQLTQQLNQYQNELSHANRQQDAFAPQNLRLMAANRALELDSLYQNLTFSRQQLSHLNQEKIALDERAPQLVAAEAAAKQIQAQCLEQEKAALNNLQIKQPILKQARQLDSHIWQLSSAIDEEISRQSALNQQLVNLESQITRQQYDVENINHELLDTQNYLAKHSHHSDLTADISLFQDNTTQLSNYLEDYTQTLEQKSQLETMLIEGQAKLTTLTQNREATLKQNEAQQQQLDTLKEQLGNQSQDKLQHQRYLLENQLEKLASINDKFGRLKSQSAQINELTHQQLTLSKTIEQSAEEINRFNSAIQALAESRQDKQAQWQLLQKVAKLEDYIADLEAGAPCPLCGATEHPYQDAHPLLASATNTSSTQVLKSAIADLDKQIAQKQAQLSTLQIQSAEMKSSFEHQQRLTPTLYQDSQRLIADAQSQLSAAFQSKHQDDAIAAPLTALQYALADSFNMFADNQHSALDLVMIEQSINRVHQLSCAINDQKSQTIANQDNLAKQTAAIEQLLTLIASNQQQLTQIDHNQQRLAYDLKIHQNNLEHNHQKIQQYCQQASALIDKLIALSQKYQFGAPMLSWQNIKQKIANGEAISNQDSQNIINDCYGFNHQLLHWQSQYLAKNELQSRLLTKQSQLQANISAQVTQRQQDLQTLSKIETAIHDKQQQKQRWQSQREQLFDGNIDDEAARLQKILDDAKANLALVHRKLDVAAQQLQISSHQQAKTGEAICRIKSSLSQQEADFQQALIEAQFSDEAAFCQALLPKNERDALNQKKLSIEQALSQAKSQLASTKTALELAQSKALTEQSLPEIALQQEALQAEFDNALSEIGAMRQKLLDNEQQKAAQSVQLLKTEQQKDHLRVWQQLYDLIGSADGKKYRTFAQSLTFEVMINHANQQLQKMSNRYLLIHDSEQPLELSVIDNYQGGEIRSTKNLSGGEGFIISLALALGLSQMASQNIRVDSLFLDEGFGTLDEESLDIALDTLTGLQQEGKLIGVISHVSALKERILTQIQVKKRSGGISILTGQGCQALAS